MKKKFGAFGAGQFSLVTLVGGRPGTTIFQNLGGGAGGGGGGSHTRTAPPPPPVHGALMLYILYVEHTMGEVEATMGRCTSRWSP